MDTRKLFQFFETPPELCARMVDMAELKIGELVIEPSAGSGNILRAMPSYVDRVAVELNPAMAPKLSTLGATVFEGDFLNFSTAQLGGPFSAAIMNPPFCNLQDVRHIMHAFAMLKPRGRLVSICGAGPRQEQRLRPLIERMGGTWEALPPNTFKASGTGVNTVLLSVRKPAPSK